MSATGRGSDRRARDAYFTPDSLAEQLVALLPIAAGARALEPHGGGGAFVRALARRSAAVEACEVQPALGPGLLAAGAREVHVGDFLDFDGPDRDWIVGNPPFLDAERHVRKALAHSENVSFLLRLAFLESRERLALWRAHPPHRVWALASRPRFAGGTTDKTAYGFFWWRRGHAGSGSIEVLDWDNGLSAGRRQRRDANTPRWQLLGEDARVIVAEVPIQAGARVAVLGGGEDALQEALSPHEPRPFAAADREDWIVGAPPTDQLEELVPRARARLAADGRLVLLLPLHALESKSRAPFWRASPPERVQVLSARPRRPDRRCSAHALALYWWAREPSPSTALTVLDDRGRGPPHALIEALTARPGARALHRDDPRLADLLQPLLHNIRTLGPRLDELSASKMVKHTTVRLLEQLIARLDALDDDPAPAGMSSLRPKRGR